MREFERIIIDDRKLNGIPHFHDTNITVSEVVSLVMKGTPNADILAQYSDLEPDDIQEALAYALDDVTQELHLQVFHDRNRMAAIGGYHAILARALRERIEISDEEKQRFTETVQRNSKESRDAWAHFDDRVSLSYYPTSDEIEWVWRILDDIKARAARFYQTEAIVEFDIQKKLPPIYAKGVLSFALTYLLFKLPIGLQVERTVLSVNIIHTDTALFRIHHDYKADSVHRDGRDFVFRRDPIGTAALIIHQHGSELKIKPDDDGVTFEFKLPVWHEDD